MVKCPTHKKVFLTEENAEQALVAAWITYGFKEGQGPVMIYRCDECGGYHLTSKGVMNTKLADLLRRGEIKKRRDENDWMEKLKSKRKL